jgi:hypothetical protein
MSEFAITPDQVKQLHAAKKSPGKTKPRPGGGFARLPYPKILKLAAALNCPELAVLAYVSYRTAHPRHREPDVLVPSKPFLEAGFSRKAKWRALRRLEEAGFIQITERRRNRNPRVLLLW